MGQTFKKERTLSELIDKKIDMFGTVESKDSVCLEQNYLVRFQMDKNEVIKDIRLYAVYVNGHQKSMSYAKHMMDIQKKNPPKNFTGLCIVTLSQLLEMRDTGTCDYTTVLSSAEHGLMSFAPPVEVNGSVLAFNEPVIAYALEGNRMKKAHFIAGSLGHLGLKYSELLSLILKNVLS